MYRTVVTICTVQWSLNIPYSRHYMYRIMVTICTVHWSIYIPYSGHYMYRKVIIICTANLTFYNSTFWPHTVFKAARAEYLIVIQIKSASLCYIKQREILFLTDVSGQSICSIYKCPQTPVQNTLSDITTDRRSQLHRW
jgi:hypothetical protein